MRVLKQTSFIRTLYNPGSDLLALKHFIKGSDKPIFKGDSLCIQSIFVDVWANQP